MVDHISEFWGPIEFRKSSIGEGGVFATQDLESGTILFVGKPFAGVFVESRERITFSLTSTPHQYFVGVMANKIRLDPDLGRDLYTLWAGPDLKSLTDNEEDPLKKVDIARIRNICNINFSGHYFEENLETFISCGLWIPLSKIMHSCIDANVMYHHHYSSLVMMITTFKKVKKGEEILTSYLNPLEPLARKNCLESLDVICKCRLCELERSESPDVIMRREEILNDLVSFGIPTSYPGHSQVVAEDFVAVAIAELESLHSASPDLNLALVDSRIHSLVAVELLDQGHHSVCLPILEKAYAVLENVAPSHQHPALVASILVCCMELNKEKAVLTKWVDELRKHCLLYAGTLDYAHPTIPEKLKKFGIEFFTDN